MFENPASADAKSTVEEYLDEYQSGPISKAELLNRLADGLPVDPAYAKKFQIKRRGKDRDDMFFAFGKVHGLENVAFADKDEVLATKGNPIALQNLVDKINDSEKPLPPASPDLAVE
jgi:hypothetical protein